MKSRFLTPLVVERAGSDKWRVVYPLEFASAKFNRIFTVPAGVLTDFASVPRLPFAYWLFGNVAQEAAVLHDHAYSGGFGLSRKQADDLFYEASKASGVAGWRAWPMWLGVRVAGSFHYTASQESMAP